MELTQSQLKELLSYDPESGVFIWKVPRRGRAKKGTVAGKIDTYGHRQIMVNTKFYSAQRLAVLYMTGAFPQSGYVVDHINRIKDDNRWINLRVITIAENCQNVSLRGRKSKSGLIGAHYDKSSKKWRAIIWANGVINFLGVFSTAELAHQAYLEAKKNSTLDLFTDS